MDHATRFRLAEDLCARMVAAHPGEVILGGVYGSTASGTDTPRSDLEMIFVLDRGSRIQRRELLCAGIAAGWFTIGQRKLESLLTRPSPEWPFWMGMLSALQPLHGDPARLAAWLEMGQAVPERRFRRALEEALPGLVVESYGRILSCSERGNRDDAGCAVLEVLFEMRTALCLLNRRWVTHDYLQGLLDTFDFPRLPAGWRELVPALWRAREIAEIVPLAERLYSAYRRLLAEEGVRWEEYARAEEVPL